MFIVIMWTRKSNIYIYISISNVVKKKYEKFNSHIFANTISNFDNHCISLNMIIIMSSFKNAF